MVIGGYNTDGVLDDIWAFDLDVREWSRMEVSGSAPPARAFFRGEMPLNRKKVWNERCSSGVMVERAERDPSAHLPR